MSLEDLRARMHDLNKTLAGAAVEANEITVALQNYRPDLPAPAPKIRFGQHKYNNSTPTDFSVFDVYDVQRGYTASKPLKPGGELYVYATIVRRPSDPQGLTQFLKPNLVPDTWCAHSPIGGLVTRTRGEGPEVLVNIAVAQWRAMAIPNIVDQVVKYGATGLYVDEVDAWWKYAWSSIATSGAREFTSENYWRNMWLTFLKELAGALHAKGKKLWINLGADYNLADAWQKALFDVVDAFNIEFYTGREGAAPGPTTTSDGWLSQGAFVSAVEQSGTPVHVHSSSLDQKVTDYAFTSWLLHAEFLGSFSASRDYGGTFAFPDGALWTKAQALGRPVGRREQISSGYTREFEHGRVTVNPNERPINTIAATSGLIEVR